MRCLALAGAIALASGSQLPVATASASAAALDSLNSSVNIDTQSLEVIVRANDNVARANAVATFTLSQVAANNTQSSCWTIVYEIVYNITTYIKRHPGGASSISKICGKDGTSIFFGQHGGTSSQALILSTYKIGVLYKPPATSCNAGYFVSPSQGTCTAAPKGYFVTPTSSAAGTTAATPCQKGYFSSTSGSTQCQIADKGFYVAAEASSTQTACAAGFITASTGSTTASACYKPIVQTIPGFSAPKALKYGASTNLAITTNTKALATYKVSGPCTAKVVSIVTKENGKNVMTKMLKVTASKKAGTCSVTLSSVAKDKYLAMSKVVKIKVSNTGN